MASLQGGRRPYGQVLTTVVIPKQETLQYLTVDSATYLHWRTLARSLSLPTDSDVASFLLQHYEKTSDLQLTQCVKCGGPVVQYCVPCNIYMTRPTSPPTLPQQDTHTPLLACDDGFMAGDTILIDLQDGTDLSLAQLQQDVILRADGRMDDAIMDTQMDLNSPVAMTHGGEGEISLLVKEEEGTKQPTKLKVLMEACTQKGSRSPAKSLMAPRSQSKTKSLLTPEILQKLKLLSENSVAEESNSGSGNALCAELQTNTDLPVSTSPHSASAVIASDVTTIHCISDSPVVNEPHRDSTQTLTHSPVKTESQIMPGCQVNSLSCIEIESQTGADCVENAESHRTAHLGLAVASHAESQKLAQCGLPVVSQEESQKCGQLGMAVDSQEDPHRPAVSGLPETSHEDSQNSGQQGQAVASRALAELAVASQAGSLPPVSSHSQVESPTDVEPARAAESHTATPPQPNTGLQKNDDWQSQAQSTSGTGPSTSVGIPSKNSHTETSDDDDSDYHCEPLFTAEDGNNDTSSLKHSDSKEENSINKTISKPVVFTMQTRQTTRRLLSSKPNSHSRDVSSRQKRSLLVKTEKPDDHSLNDHVIIITDNKDKRSSSHKQGSLQIGQASQRKRKMSVKECKTETPTENDLDSKVSVLVGDDTSTLSHAKRKRYTNRGEKIYVCELCGEEFPFRRDRKRHIRERHGERPYACTQCSATYTTPSHLKVHINQHAEIKPHQCSQCPRTFARAYDLKNHQLTHSTDRPIVCEVCGMGLKSAKFLRAHMRTHNQNDKPFICQLCGMTFRWRCNLNDHLRIHNNEKRFTCPHCGMKYIQSGSLRRHIQRRHTPNRPRPFVCHVCGEARYEKTQFEKHMMIHTGVKPYKCEICGAAFIQANALVGHKKIHTEREGKSHLCIVCGAAFKMLSSVKKHVNKVHSELKDLSIATVEIIELE